MKKNSAQCLHFFSSSAVGDWGTSLKYSTRFKFHALPSRRRTLPFRGRISGAKRNAAPRWQAVPWNGWFGVSRFRFTNQSHSTFTPTSFTTLRQTAISFLIVARNCSGVPPTGETPSLCSFSVVSGREGLGNFAVEPIHHGMRHSLGTNQPVP